jgi:hypothetical protein
MHIACNMIDLILLAYYLETDQNPVNKSLAHSFQEIAFVSHIGWQRRHDETKQMLNAEVVLERFPEKVCYIYLSG